MESEAYSSRDSEKFTDYTHDAANKLAEATELDQENHNSLPPNSPYGISVSELTVLQDTRDPYVIKALGGIDQLEQKLNTSKSTGLHVINNDEDVSHRRDTFGTNKLPERPPKSFFALLWMALQDKVLVLLTIVAVVSLALGLYETFGRPTEYDENGNAKPKVEWVEGVAIMVAVIIVSVVGAANDWQKERQFVKLNRKKEEYMIKVIRDGHTKEISVFDIMVGDLVLIEPGDVMSTDGILVNGYGIKTDEAALTGESANVKKSTVDDVMRQLNANPSLSPSAKGIDPFILSGSKILEGTGSYIVTSVGVNSFHGKMLLSLQTDPEETPLQEKLNVIAENIAKLGFLAAIIMFIVLFIRFLVQLKGSPLSSAEKGQEFINILITSITIIVVAVPEGLPLAVTLALAFATTRMVKDNNLVRVLKACETMGGATAICSDKTGTLTQNKMSIVRGFFGLHSSLEIDPDIHSNTEAPPPLTLPEPSKLILMESIVANSSAFENLETNSEPNSERFIGSKTETALLNFARDTMNMGHLDDEKKKIKILRVYPFDSAKKFMATVIQHPSGVGVRLLIKGAAEIMLKMCQTVHNEDDSANPVPIKQYMDIYYDHINTYASGSLRTIGLIYRDFPEMKTWEPNSSSEESLFSQMTMLGLVGIMDPLRPGVKKAVADCQHAGVVVRMVTGDNLLTAQAIAKDCGIIESNANEQQLVMEGPEFRKLSNDKIKELLPNLKVLARSSPDDKRLLVKNLKEMGETVAVTGDGTNDAPALKLADVGFSMGIAGTEIAKEASEIILMDDNFGSIVKAILWGRTVNDAVKKFLQFQITVNITAVVLTFVTAVASSNNESVLTAVQLLWVNLIMDTFAALALATDPPAPSALDRKPDNRKASLITPCMWKIILGEATYQLIVCLVLHFAGESLFSAHTPNEREQLHAMVFNTFVWMQYFKMFVSRRLDNKLNMFEGIWKNWYYLVISGIILGAQILIMFVGGAAFSIVRQTGVQWAIAICFGFGSIPVGILLRLLPDLPEFPPLAWPWGSKSNPQIMVSDLEKDPNELKWPEPFEQVKQDLLILKIKGGRWSQLKHKPKQIITHFRHSFTSSSSSAADDASFLKVPKPSSKRRGSSSTSSIEALTMVPTLVGGAIAGWGAATPDQSLKVPSSPQKK